MPNVRLSGGKPTATTVVEVDDILTIGVKQGDGSYVDFNISIRNLLGQNVESLKDLTLAADKGLYSTGANTLALFDLSNAGRALIDDADTTAQRTTLGLGGLAILDPADLESGGSDELEIALSQIPGLGTAAESDTGDFATAAQGALADSAVQPAALAAHEADTTAIHGITDTSQIATLNTAQTITGIKTITASSLRVQGTAPGFWLDETDGALKGAFFILNGGGFQIQRRSSNFGGYEAIPFNIAVTAPDNSFVMYSSGIIEINNALRMGSEVIVTSLGHIRPRQYPDASFPSASLYRGEEIYGLTTNKHYGSNGTAWNAYY